MHSMCSCSMVVVIVVVVVFVVVVVSPMRAITHVLGVTTVRLTRVC